MRVLRSRLLILVQTYTDANQGVQRRMVLVDFFLFFFNILFCFVDAIHVCDLVYDMKAIHGLC